MGVERRPKGSTVVTMGRWITVQFEGVCATECSFQSHNPATSEALGVKLWECDCATPTSLTQDGLKPKDVVWEAPHSKVLGTHSLGYGMVQRPSARAISHSPPRGMETH